MTPASDTHGALTVMCVAGARPNFPKVKPVLAALEHRGVDTIFVHTGQHYDKQMSEVFLDELGIRAPNFTLSVGSGSHAEQTARLLTAFEPLVDRLQPDVVLVVGDVNSTVGCALVASRAGSLVAHVEAGLRSRDWSMPEEINRVVTDRLSDYLFAPSPDAEETLRAEGYRDDQIHLVGNVMIDTLLANKERALERVPEVRRSIGLDSSPFALVTLHRPSNVDDPVQLAQLARALDTIAHDIPVILPAHPRTARQLRRLDLARSKDFVVISPLGYLDFLGLEAVAALVLTDSGGVQEETTALGIPCLTLREQTERPITVTDGTNRVVGTSVDTIVTAAKQVLAEGVEPRRPALWDGKASERIANVIVAGGRAADRKRPTELA